MPDKFNVTVTTLFYLFSNTVSYIYDNLLYTEDNLIVVKYGYMAWEGYVPSFFDYHKKIHLIELERKKNSSLYRTKSCFEPN